MQLIFSRFFSFYTLFPFSNSATFSSPSCSHLTFLSSSHSFPLLLVFLHSLAFYSFPRAFLLRLVVPAVLPPFKAVVTDEVGNIFAGYGQDSTSSGI